MTTDLTVRKAVVADAAGIAQVHIQAWRESYVHLLPAAVLAGLQRRPRETRWRETIAAGASDVWVACAGTDIVGWASAGPGRDDDGPRPRELQGIYVLASHYGSGAGQLLLDAAIGNGGAHLWIAEDNPRAFAFYLRNGFVPDGATATHELAGTPVRILRMVR
ncbi:GNAT superfamily N-acetyltransferase [Arthrobacter ginsengisoli]|uniref:GNAT superfamily N-acetyltransferase n=1 Tax=Arthrobacter ginsengisoli TaxID=1356565 RepID=A0ABU1UI97_9MICC|nr:GNAT family N-acetyltransferase [Arthrobacter ginsengisoli]MDR7084866.1 GNAT superfamily N-acetyltransferase [Arthrobacter ginsengisoli]